jgi:hypothetical protein
MLPGGHRMLQVLIELFHEKMGQMIKLGLEASVRGLTMQG